MFEELAKVLVRIPVSTLNSYSFSVLIATYSEAVGLHMNKDQVRRCAERLRKLVGVHKVSQWTEEHSRRFRELDPAVVQVQIELSMIDTSDTSPSGNMPLPNIKDLL